jgi:dCTP deaminase
MLSDGEILDAMKQGDLLIEPYSPELLQPCSIDLRVGRHFLVQDPDLYFESGGRVRARTIKIPDVGAGAEMQPIDMTTTEFPLYPGALVLASTVEHVKLGAGIIGKVDGRSTFGRLGLVVHQTAGLIDCGFEGNITLELTNASPNTLMITPMTPICQISFYRCAPALRPYGAARGSKYQGQVGPTSARTAG